MNIIYVSGFYFIWKTSIKIIIIIIIIVYTVSFDGRTSGTVECRVYDIQLAKVVRVSAKNVFLVQLMSQMRIVPLHT